MNIKINPDYDTVLLMESNPALWLCGSRYFAMKYPDKISITEETDFDYHGPFDMDTVKFLLGLNPIRVVNNEDNYFGKFTEAIFYFQGVQVVLDKYPECSKAVFDSMSPDFYSKYIRKNNQWSPKNFTKCKEIIELLTEAELLKTNYSSNRIGYKDNERDFLHSLLLYPLQATRFIKC